ncbi:DUF1624 domain-containing protein [Luteimonas sp. BDR2-5]|uniref:acyltransferase family protein n=1 Tax=Proluteimonas luteida TaxID=2878685 RepID=UPI001E36DC06|nr:acyltransferase family protein [Luteimonas sp. BDR2-5]MCD9027392.1 DUF1624 domain-containing protein [Luteimonas sp. BDR2-5]
MSAAATDSTKTTTPRPATAAAATVSPGQGRIGAIDFARGIAVCLMILSHGTNGLMPFDDFPSWGQVPVHAITKFSSSLFVIVFGIALAVAFVPKTGAPDWPQRRNRLLWRGLVVLFWYKVLTVVEMYGRYDREAIVDTLLYRNFPSFVEILGFYAIALLWIPWLLPLWAKAPAWLRWLSPVPVAFASWWLLHHFDFWGVPQLQAVLVEHPDYYAWGQLARGPLILVGLLIGGLLLRCYGDPRTRLALAGGLTLVAAVLLGWFLLRAGDAELRPLLVQIARNVGKHPPQLMFMLFSVGGAFALLALAIAGGQTLAKWLRPVAVIGSDALMAFIVHISVIFLLFREVLGYYQAVSYERALLLTAILIVATAAWIWLWQRMKQAVQR